LIDNPPPPKNVDPAFIGRDWQQISIGELVSPEDLRFVEMDTGIEEATNVSHFGEVRNICGEIES
jgi:hypothetical protein